MKVSLKPFFEFVILNWYGVRVRNLICALFSMQSNRRCQGKVVHSGDGR